MTPFLALFILFSAAEPIQCNLGVPVTIDYSIPDNFVPQSLEVTDDFILLQQNGDTVTIVPLVLDTLLLPPMHAVDNTREMDFAPPSIEVLRTMPDTTWNVSVFPSPVTASIPSGFPEDYLNRHRFWEKWGRRPPNRWLLPIILLLVLNLAVIIFLILRRRSHRPSDLPSRSKTYSPIDEVNALLKSKAFAEGRWMEYYRDVDRLLRDTVSFRFGVSNRALTWHQIDRKLARDKEGRKFVDNSHELTREITLQRYASWGGSRDRAKRYTSALLSLRKEWHK